MPLLPRNVEPLLKSVPRKGSSQQAHDRVKAVDPPRNIPSGRKTSARRGLMIANSSRSRANDSSDVDRSPAHSASEEDTDDDRTTKANLAPTAFASSRTTHTANAGRPSTTHMTSSRPATTYSRRQRPQQTHDAKRQKLDEEEEGQKPPSTGDSEWSSTSCSTATTQNNKTAKHAESPSTVPLKNPKKKSRETNKMNGRAGIGKLNVPGSIDSPEKSQEGIRLPAGCLVASPSNAAPRLNLLLGDEDSDQDPPPSSREAPISSASGAPSSSQVLKQKLDKNRRPKAPQPIVSPPLKSLRLPDDIQLGTLANASLNGKLDLDLSSSEESEPNGSSDSVAKSSYGPATCPWCGEAVDEQLLQTFSKGRRLNVRMQSKFCAQHKEKSALDIWRSRQYPEIDWQKLAARFDGHHEFLLGIVNGRSSYFRSLLADKVESGQSRRLRKEENLNPGYYGPRGFTIMCDYLVGEFGGLLKAKAVQDRVIAGRGSAAFIQYVLVPELAVQLIMEDLGVPEDEAHDVMEESKALGEMLHGEL